jgi:arginase family enzyme
MRFEGFYDAGNLVAEGDTELFRQELFEFVANLQAGAVPIAIGGDHSITLPLVSAVSALGSKPIKVVIFDHHLDFQYWSKERGAPFHTNVMTHVSDLLGPGQVVHLGVEPVQTVGAGLHEWYLAYLQRAGIQIPLFSSGLNSDEFVAKAVGRGQDVYLSIDVDVLGRAEMSSTAYPSDTGLSLGRTIELIRLISAENRIVGCDLVEFGAPAHDRGKATLSDAARATALLLELIIAVASQRRPGKKSADERGENLDGLTHDFRGGRTTMCKPPQSMADENGGS